MDGLDEFINMIYDFSKKNPNEFRNYYKYIKGVSELNIPDTEIIPVSDYYLKILCLEKIYEHSDDFAKYLIDYLKNNNFNIDRDLFIKDGKFSNKFNFNTSMILNGDISNIGIKAFEIMYGDMCLTDFPSTDIIVREFIHTSYDRPSIYFGLKLNTEFRVFYNFDNNDILGIFNYWDNDTMMGSLKDGDIGNDYVCDRSIFSEVSDEINNDFLYLKDDLYNLVNSIFPNIGLSGEYSADFLWDGSRFRLIDMALANQSYYYDKIKRKV